MAPQNKTSRSRKAAPRASSPKAPPRYRGSHTCPQCGPRVRLVVQPRKPSSEDQRPVLLCLAEAGHTKVGYLGDDGSPEFFFKYKCREIFNSSSADATASNGRPSDSGRSSAVHASSSGSDPTTANSVRRGRDLDSAAGISDTAVRKRGRSDVCASSGGRAGKRRRVASPSPVSTRPAERVAYKVHFPSFIEYDLDGAYASDDGDDCSTPMQKRQILEVVMYEHKCDWYGVYGGRHSKKVLRTQVDDLQLRHLPMTVKRLLNIHSANTVVDMFDPVKRDWRTVDANELLSIHDAEVVVFRDPMYDVDRVDEAMFKDVRRALREHAIRDHHASGSDISEFLYDLYSDASAAPYSLSSSPRSKSSSSRWSSPPAPSKFDMTAGSSRSRPLELD